MVRKVMISFALFWICLWCICGVYLGMTRQAFAQDMGQIAASGDLAAFWRAWSSAKAETTAHSHALCASFVLMLIGLAMPYMGYSEPMKWVVGVCLIVAVVLSSVFQWLGVLPPMMIGNLLLVVMVLVSLAGAVMGPSQEADA